MSRLIIDSKLKQLHPEIVNKLTKSRYASWFFSDKRNHRVRKTDIVVLSSTEASSDNVDQKYSKAIIFDDDSFEFSSYNFDNFFYLAKDIPNQELNSFLGLILKNDLEQKAKKLKMRSKKFLKRLSASIKNDDLLSSYYQRKLVQITDDWLDSKDLDSFYNIVSDTLNLLLPKKMKFLSLTTINYDALDRQDMEVLWFGSNDYFLITTNLEMNSMDAKVIFQVHKKLSLFYQELQRYNDIDKENIKTSDLFHQIEDPIVVSSNRNIYMYNKAFLNLNITAKDLLKLDEDQLFKKNNKVFQLQIRSLEHYIIYQFKENEKLADKQKDQDLGIITSSIAHELNNPLAAILAAIEVLKLEDDLDEETEMFLYEMEQGARRSQNLTQTFLGFSRNQMGELKETFEVILERAYELVRYKEIENNIKLKFQIAEKLKQMSFHSSIMTMAIYLILNDILLSYSRYSLVSGQITSKVSLNFKIDDKGIILELLPKVNLNPSLLKSKLLDYLLKEQFFQIEIRDNNLIFNQI